jgi:hypothetical protein
MNERLQIAETVHQARIQIAIQAYEDAGRSGLGHEGRWEYAVDAIRGLALRPFWQPLTQHRPTVACRVHNDSILNHRCRFLSGISASTMSDRS